MGGLFSTDASLIQLLLRLTLAIVIFPHGAQKALGWKPRVGFHDLVKMMVEADLELAEREARAAKRS